jgi:hypothetical protein
MEGVMGKYVLFFMLFSILIFPQSLLLEENFDYSTGDLVSSSDWEESPDGPGTRSAHSREFRQMVAAQGL